MHIAHYRATTIENNKLNILNKKLLIFHAFLIRQSFQGYGWESDVKLHQLAKD